MTFKHKLARRLALLKDALPMLALAALGCEKPVALTDSNPASVTQVVVVPDSTDLDPSQTQQFAAFGRTAAGDSVPVTVQWTASAGAVTPAGLYTADASESDGTVTATLSGSGTSGHAHVRKRRVVTIVVSPSAVALATGQSQQFSTYGRRNTGDSVGVAVTYTATGGSIGGGGLYAAGATAGSYRVIATRTGGTLADTAAVTVTTIPVASVSVSPGTPSVAVGGTVQLTATTRDAAGNPLTGRGIAWSSSATGVATVDANGLVKGVTAGAATITALSEGKSATASLTVMIVPVASVQVSPTSGTIATGQTLQLAATPKDSAGNTLSGRAVTWTSGNTGVASVSGSGLVTGKVAGSATITATSEGKSAAATLTVTQVPVATVQVAPASGTISTGQTLQLAATTKDAAGNTVTGRPVTWASSNISVATVTPAGLVVGVVTGSATITATSEGKSGTASVTVQASIPTGLLPDPTLLPVGAGQDPNVSAYQALNVASKPAGFSYNDPVTGVKVWKVTSSSTPVSNVGAGHDYGDGGDAVSRGWGPNNNTHTILVYTSDGGNHTYYLVDFTRGVGLSNYRTLAVGPRRDMCASFSNVPGSERILYIHTGSQLVRFNTATMQTENTGNFPLSNNIYTWLHQDRNDVWFTGLLDDNQTVWAWNSQTGQYLTHLESWTNEPRMERNGRYVVLTAGSSPSTVKVWDLSNNTFGPQQSMEYFSHLASLRGRWMSVSPNLSAPPPLDRYQVVGGSLTRTPGVFSNSGGYETNNSGNWIQNDDNAQWAYVSGTDEQSFSNLYAFQQGVGLVRADGSDARLLVHHYTHNPTYWDYAWGQPSPDGKVALFNSNMYGSGRVDLFVAEVPLR